MTESLLTKNLPAEIQAGRLRDETSGSDWNAPDNGSYSKIAIRGRIGREFFYAAFALSLNPFSYQRSHATTSGVVRMCFSGASFRLRFLLLNSSIQAG